MSKTGHHRRGFGYNQTTKQQQQKQQTKKKKIKQRTFKRKDFYSGDGMLTTVWGPSQWHFLHTMSFNYPVEPTPADKKNYKDYILSLRAILPCKYCRINLTNNLKANPITMADMRNRDSFSRYVYKLHETVNKMLKKKSGLTYCDVRERYEHFRSRCTDEKPKVFPLEKQVLEKQVLEKQVLEKQAQKQYTLKNQKPPSTLKNKNGSEKGCTEPLYGKKAKCIIKIVPQEEKCPTMQIDQKCLKERPQDIS